MSETVPTAATAQSAGAAAPAFDPNGSSLVVQADNLAYLSELPDASFTVIYIDPPFNTGKTQTRRTLKTAPAQEGGARGDRTGFQGKSYTSALQTLASYHDAFEDYWAFLEPRIRQAHRLLTQDGTLYLHLDWREVHYAKVMCDMIFGRDCFMNELIWAYDYGAKSTKRWPTKHDNILMYVKDPQKYYFNADTVDREPYMAPGLVTEEKAARGKLPTDVWWHTIVSPTGKEKTGYPTQKPVGLLKRMIVCVDQNPPAIEVMAKRLNVEERSFAAYRGVPRGAAVLFTPQRSVGVRGGTSRDALTAASRRALAAQSRKVQESVEPVPGASSVFVRHHSTDAVDKDLRIRGRDVLRRERRRQQLAKERAQTAKKQPPAVP